MDQPFEFSTSLGSSVDQTEHDLILKGRRQLDITGVKQVESFDNEQFLLETVMGFLAIRGQQLHMKNLNVELGHVSIEGKILDLIYLDQHEQSKSKSLLGKLFK